MNNETGIIIKLLIYLYLSIPFLIFVCKVMLIKSCNSVMSPQRLLDEVKQVVKEHIKICIGVKEDEEEILS